ncbi:hypothetical protein [Methanobrevibacter sp.]|uniref:hypothetical protein n=1 Tax=Methanobrevibacter sp. TaxID=66852 RepID=UPI0025F38DEE|nr:hypothetical protein [Methanobrevibacter sp.]MBQ6512158.1 hypothetical protein [Methanobrevibacter sp.]
MSMIDKFRKQHILVQILDVIFIIVLIYGLITMQISPILWIMLFLIVFIPFCQWFLKKEE